MAIATRHVGETLAAYSVAMPADLQFVTIHGYIRAFRMAGEGPPLLLIHGLGCDSSTWDPVFDELAKSHTVIAPDLLGHGASDKPRGDYSVAGYANGMRDLLTVLGISKVTVVGHSFGGGVGGQFAYQYPEMIERLVLVDAGGMGPDVTPLIRFLSVPGSSTALAVAASAPLRPIIAGGMTLLSRLGLPITHDLDEVAKVYRTLGDPASRRAVQSLVRHVVDWRGVFITMADRHYLLERVPVLIIWGEHDFVVPMSHARRAASDPMRDVVVIDDAGHFPFRDEPETFVELIEKFLAAHPPATFVRSRWQRALRTGPLPLA